MSAANFFSGLLQGFAGTQQKMKERKDQEQENKARVKLYEIQLAKEQRAAQNEAVQREAMQRISGAMAKGSQVRGPELPGVMGPPRGQNQPMGLMDMLSDPRLAMDLIQSGMVSPKDLMGAQESAKSREMVQGLLGGGAHSQAAGGLELSGVKLDTQGKPMLDFARPEVWKEVPDQSGLNLLMYDKQGRLMGKRPASPGEKPQPTEEDKRTRETATAYNVYLKAREGLLSGLGGTATGPLIGKTPAITTAQQTAVGSVAAMAPVLKQLFRAAGEGVFTDRDQQLLLDMIPTRETNPDARAALMDNIDKIVKAKLGIGAPQGSKVISFKDLPE